MRSVPSEGTGAASAVPVAARVPVAVGSGAVTVK